MFAPEVGRAAQRHALSEWPKEAVGYIVNGVYVPQVNIAPDPASHFAVADAVWITIGHQVQAVVHSHISLGPLPADHDARAPSQADMQAQLSAAVPFGILATDGEVATDILWFGDQVLEEPLLGRAFVPGVTDCYELARAWFWQEHKIKLPSVPRDPQWWDHGGDLFAKGFADAGFVRIAIEDAKPGDGLLMAIPATGVINHCAVLLDGGVMLHHRAGQLSRREPWSGGSRRLTRMVVRLNIAAKSAETMDIHVS